MLKTTDAFLFSPELPVRRMVPLLLLVILLLSLMTACQEPAPARPEPYPNSSLALAALDVNCTEARLKLSLTNLDSLTGDTLPIVLRRNGHFVQTLNFVPPDTILWDDNLEPNRDCTYTAYRRSVYNTSLVDSSNTISLTTMDTTSHDFQFESYTFGGEPGTGFSTLYDVAIIDENNIWAVGEIYVPDLDSSWNGTGWKDYSVAQWDGEEWNLKVLQAGSVNVHPRGIWAFSENDIWFASGSIYHWDGENTSLEWMRDISSIETVEAVWGSSPENIYFVGNEGTIVHHDGSGFTRLESGTELPLHDIFGAFNPVSGQWEVISVGSNFRSDQPFQRVILKIENRTVQELSSRPMGYTLHSVWFIPEKTYLVAGSGIWHKSILQTVDWQLVSLQDYYTFKIRGTAINDIVAVGGYFDILHHNGINWQRLDPGIPRTGDFKSVSMKGDLVVAVGFDGRRGIILKGQRF